jgi:hypothetical protein
MAAVHRYLCIAIGSLGLALPAQAQTGRDLGSVITEIDQGFVCPQFRPDDAARRADMVAFSRAIASVGPTRISYRQAAYIHAKLLERHNCGQRSTVAAAEPVEVPTAPVTVSTGAAAVTPN